MDDCLHTKIFIETKPEPKSGQYIRAYCACKKIVTNWHRDERKAQKAFEQIKEDMRTRGKL